MSEYFEIAYAAASNRLCLFTGTGFSKAITNNSAPTWQELLESVCDVLPDPSKLKLALFPADKKNPLGLEEAAQVIAIELQRLDKHIHEEIANRIRTVKLAGDNSAITTFTSKRSFRVVTTNYDKLMEELVGEKDCHSLTPGLPVPRSQARVKVFHVHGSIDSPENMVVTADDYFRFLNRESYFSQKLSTVLHENTVVILGYKLGDTNLKAILSDYNGFSRNQVIGSNLFFVSRSKIDGHIKDYYSQCYGIRVLDQTDISDFFIRLHSEMPHAEKNVSESIESSKNVLFHKHKYSIDYLKLETSFYEIVASFSAIGRSINDPLVVPVLGQIIKTKQELTNETGAWTQYEHLARWLIHLASKLELRGTSIESAYLDATLHSMTTMSSKLYFGYSWHAFKAWSNRWSGIIASNRAIIKKHIEAKSSYPDALAVVSRG